MANRYTGLCILCRAVHNDGRPVSLKPGVVTVSQLETPDGRVRSIEFHADCKQALLAWAKSQ